MEEMNLRIIKTQSVEQIVAFFDGDCTDRQELLWQAFEIFPILDIREFCIKKIIPAGKDNFLWLCRQGQEYFKIKDWQTVLLLLGKIAQYNCKNNKGGSKSMDLSILLAFLKCWLNEDNRVALKSGLNILFEKIERDEIYTKEVRMLFLSIFEKYLNKDIEKTDKDYQMLDDMLSFIIKLKDVNFFIPTLKKGVEPISTIREPGKNSSRNIFVIDLGIVI